MSETVWWGDQEASPVVDGGRETPVSAANPDSARKAFLEGAALFDLGWRDRIALEGADARTYLHGQCSQAVADRPAGEGGYAFVLDPRGKVLADLRFLIVTEDSLRLELPPGRGAALLPWLRMFVINRDARLEPRDDEWSALGIAGPRCDEFLAKLDLPAPPQPRGHGVTLGEPAGGLSVVRDRDYASEGARILGPRQRVADLARALLEAGAQLVGRQDLDAARVRCGTPEWGRELSDAILPEEAGQKERAVSFTKGCYCGQEAIAKQHFLGRPRRRLVRLEVELDGPLPAELEVRSGARKLGYARTFEPTEPGRARALAILKGAAHEPGAALELWDEAGQPAGHAQVADLPVA